MSYKYNSGFNEFFNYTLIELNKKCCYYDFKLSLKKGFVLQCIKWI